MLERSGSQPCIPQSCARNRKAAEGLRSSGSRVDVLSLALRLNRGTVDFMPVADGPMAPPSAAHSLVDAFKKASHSAEQTSRPPTAGSPEEIRKDRGLRIDVACKKHNPTLPGRDHGGHDSGHIAKNTASEHGRRSPRHPGG